MDNNNNMSHLQRRAKYRFIGMGMDLSYINILVKIIAQNKKILVKLRPP